MLSKQMKALDYAMRTKNWELAALCLAIGVVEALNELPRDSVDEMLALLAPDPPVRQAGAESRPADGQEGSTGRRERLRGRQPFGRAPS